MNYHTISTHRLERQRSIDKGTYERNNKRAQRIQKLDTRNDGFGEIPSFLFWGGVGVTALFIGGCFCPPLAYATLGICGIVIIGGVGYFIYHNI